MIALRKQIRLLVLIAAVVSLFAVPGSARADTYTTFSANSEGCSGGGEFCGGFPLIPAGTAASSFAADPAGHIDIDASVSGGIPSLACAPGVTCLPVLAQYHAEAAAVVWIDVDVPAGAHSVTVRATSHVTEVSEAASPTIGHVRATALGTISALEAGGTPLATCSDSSAVTGRAFEVVTTGPAEHVLDATIACAGDGAVLSGARWRVALIAKVAATTDGGTADARVRAELISVSLDFV